MPVFPKLVLGSAAGIVLFVAAPALSQAVALTPESSGQAHAAGQYAGVKPGGSEMPAVAAQPGAGPCTITWPGFQMQPDGSSRVFLQTTSPVSTTADNDGKRLVFELGDVRIGGDNNALPLETRYFDTPVTRVELKREKGNTRLVITLRTPVTPRVSSERAPSGFYFLYIDFPATGTVSAPVSTLDEGPPKPDEPATNREPPNYLDGNVNASGSVQTGSGKAKAKAKAKGKVEAKGGFSL